ncbi:MAG: hypothetical protein J0L57_01680 [Burkholderiales bacterium]|jgi:hypothetical protein|nr:hypothetical protein [Burkholderiales bacterium]
MARRFIRPALVVAMMSAGVGTATAGVEAIPDDMPMPDYLGLLGQISPAAQRGAQAYLLAFEQRCGRPLRTAQLRQAMADGDGDPVLMAMIRASHLRDASALGPLGERIRCEQGPAR